MESLEEQQMLIGRPTDPVNNLNDHAESESLNDEDDSLGEFQMQDIEEHNEGMIRGEMERRMQARVEKLDKDLAAVQKRRDETREKVERLKEKQMSTSAAR
jgi:hypothetical protein